MKYKSKLRIPIMLNENEIKEQEFKLKLLNQEKIEILNIIKHEEDRNRMFRLQLESGMSVSSSFFAGGRDRLELLEREADLAKIEQKIDREAAVYAALRKKSEKLVEMDKKREKEFNDEIEKKVFKKQFWLKNAWNHLQDGRDETND